MGRKYEKLGMPYFSFQVNICLFFKRKYLDLKNNSICKLLLSDLVEPTEDMNSYGDYGDYGNYDDIDDGYGYESTSKFKTI